MHKLRILSLATVLAVGPCVLAKGLNHVCFLVIDPLTRKPIEGNVRISDANGRVFDVATGSMRSIGFNPIDWSAEKFSDTDTTLIMIPAGETLTIQQKEELPVKEITIKVTATRLKPKSPATTNSTIRDNTDLKKFGGGGGGNDNTKLTKGQAGVAEDSAGQAHVRGEHGEIAYVVDGVPLPDTLSGRQGSIVVQSTIQTLEMITGGFAPEFGGQTAAILNISTLSEFKQPKTDYSTSFGSFNTYSGQITAVGPAGSKVNFVVDIAKNRTSNAQESPQPDNQTAHNDGSSSSYFTKFRLTPNKKDVLTFTFSNSPGETQIANRAGLPASFASAGQGFGLFGLRNADGARPDVNAGNAGLLGAAPMVLGSQQQVGQDINQKEVSEFATINYNRKIAKNESAQIALTILHSGQDVTNNNPAVDQNNLPVDSSIEFNPTALRNVHHFQLSGNWDVKRGAHQLKAGFLMDSQSGNETYRIEPGSQLALDALAAIAPNLAPTGNATGELDINGNPVFTATGAVPTLNVRRTGTYKAAYLQDTYKSGRVTANYGLRGDWYTQEQNLGQQNISTFELSPRVNLQYQVDSKTEMRAAYNHLFNTPPLAQGAVVGAAIQPETLNQYDLAMVKKLAPNRSVTLAYYYKDIRNQVDTGLLIPGSQIGLYSAVNLERGGVHGVELSYDISANKGIGWDSYFHYSLSAAKPNGLDSTGEPVDAFNDHDQRHTIGIGAAYTWKSGASLAATIDFGSGLASSPIPPNENRVTRTQVDLHYTTGDRVFRGKGGISLDVSNLFDDRTVINFQSAFSGTRFMQGRRIGLSIFGRF
jgi:outer membrane receptor protein involved in Fe transport